MESSSQLRVEKHPQSSQSSLWSNDGFRSTGNFGALIAASMICADPLNMGNQIRLLEEGQIDLLHFDVMDGNFVPRLGMFPEILQAVRKSTHIPADVHLMVSDPEKFIPVFAEAGADAIIIHAEATSHLPRLLNLIRNCGAKPGVALNPATPLDVLNYVVDDLDIILLMTTDPGIIGGKLHSSAIRKIKDVHKFLGNAVSRVHVMVDGNVTSENASILIGSGATILVCGTSSIFGKESNVRESLNIFRRALQNSLKSKDSYLDSRQKNKKVGKGK